jgi:hypothetical protein
VTSTVAGEALELAAGDAAGELGVSEATALAEVTKEPDGDGPPHAATTIATSAREPASDLIE